MTGIDVNSCEAVRMKNVLTQNPTTKLKNQRLTLLIERLRLRLGAGASLAAAPKFSCHVCGQAFGELDQLTEHVESRHRGGKSTHQCDVCHRRFGRADVLARHARVHDGAKPYTCVTCGLPFSRSDHLVNHKRTHTGEKPYACTSCPYRATRRDLLTRHMRKHRKDACVSRVARAQNKKQLTN